MGVLFLKQPLANLEDEIFLKGGSVVTPQKFDLILLIKILPGNLNFCFLDFLLISEPFFPLFLWSFTLVKSFQSLLDLFFPLK